MTQFNLGAVVGAAIPLGQNWNNEGGAVAGSTYIAFLVSLNAVFSSHTDH